MQFREHPGVMGKRDAYPFDPRLLKIDEAYNVRNLDSADERDDLAELKESVRANGVRVPLEVRLVDDDVFVVAGHRRHRVVMDLIGEGEDIKSVPVMPEPKYTNDADRILNLIVSNSGKPLKPLEIAEVVRRLVAFGWDEGQIAKRIGWKSKASVKQHLDMLAMPEPVKAQVRQGDISATAAAKVMKNLPVGTDPAFAAALIAANKAENEKLGVGAKTGHKVTPKTLKRDHPKPAAKAAEPPKHEPKPEVPAQPFVAEVETAPQDTPPSEVHAQLQAASERENGSGNREVNLKPPVEIIVTHPNLKAMVSAEITSFLGEIAKIAEDNSLGERDPEEGLPVPVSLIARGDRLYRQIIGDL